MDCSNHGYTRKYFELGTLAARQGHFEVLKWFHLNGLVINAWTSRSAAKSGNLELLQWVKDNGFPPDKETCSAAINSKQLHILKWAIENGCKMDDSLCMHAALCGNVEVLQWAKESGVEMPTQLYRKAAQHGNLSVLKWLQKEGLTINLEFVVSTVLEKTDPRPNRRRPILQKHMQERFEETKKWLLEEFADVVANTPPSSRYFDDYC